MTSHLRPALLFNAAFSLFSGALIAIAPATVGSWLGVDIDGWLRLFGLALIGHAAAIAALLPRLPLRTLGVVNLLAIAPYPLIMIVLVVTGLITRTLGQTLALVDGAIIGAVAIAHVQGLRNPAPVSHPQPA